MSSHTAGVLVIFKDDINDEAAAELCRLLRWIDGVIDVQPVTTNVDQIIAQSHADHEWRMNIIGLLKEKANL